MRQPSYEILETTTGYAGFFHILRYRLRHRLFKGGWSPVLTRELFERGHAAAVPGTANLVEGDMRDFLLDQPVPLVTIPYRTFQHNLERTDQLVGPRDAFEAFLADPLFPIPRDGYEGRGLVGNRSVYVFDRDEASHAINLFDMHEKYADVIALDDALALAGEQAGAWTQ